MSKYSLSKEFMIDNKIKLLYLGSGREYYISKNHLPYARIQVTSTFHPFDTAIIFENYLCIGICDEVYFINLDSMKMIKKLTCDLYFGYFYIIDQNLLIAEGTRVTMLNRDLEIQWRSEFVADDGVIFLNTDNDKIELNCIFDPPDGDSKIIYLKIADGSVIK